MTTASRPGRSAASIAGRDPATGRLGNALVLGFDAEYASVVCEVLSGTFELRMTTAPEIALGLLARHHYDAVVIEKAGTGSVPLQSLLRHVRSSQPETGIVVTSQRALLAREVVEVFEADADECIVAPFHPNEFLARVTRMVRRAQTRAAARAVALSEATCDSEVATDRTERTEHAEAPRHLAPSRPAAEARELVGVGLFR